MSSDERPVRALIVAEHLIWMRDTISTTPMQVVKLVYLAHGWMLGLTQKELINEPVEAWTYGPVVPSVYHHYKSFGGSPITDPVSDHSSNFGERQKHVIEMTADLYSECTGIELSKLTHQPNTPWDITRRQYGIGTDIPNELIKQHFRLEEDVSS